jgi:hypothetical protein
MNTRVTDECEFRNKSFGIHVYSTGKLLVNLTLVWWNVPLCLSQLFPQTYALPLPALLMGQQLMLECGLLEIALWPLQHGDQVIKFQVLPQLSVNSHCQERQMELTVPFNSIFARSVWNECIMSRMSVCLATCFTSKNDLRIYTRSCWEIFLFLFLIGPVV